MKVTQFPIEFCRIGPLFWVVSAALFDGSTVERGPWGYEIFTPWSRPVAAALSTRDWKVAGGLGGQIPFQVDHISIVIIMRINNLRRWLRFVGGLL